MKLMRSIFFVIGFLIANDVAFAASTTPKEPDAAAVPAAKDGAAELTTATYGDWLLRCNLSQAAAGQTGKNNCEIIQNIVLQGQSAPFAQLGFGKLTPDAPLYFTAVIPINVSFPSAVRIGDSKDDKAPIDVPFTRCLPTGCFASIQVSSSMLVRWRALSGAGAMTFKSGDGQDVTVPMSFKGIARALDAYAKAGLAPN